MTSPGRGAGARPAARLNRDRVLRAALALADTERDESLSMRKLGEARGRGHVAVQPRRRQGGSPRRHDRPGISEIELPTGTQAGGPRCAAGDLDPGVLSRHRWAIGLMESRTSPGPATMATTTPCSAACGGPASRRAGRPCLRGPGQLHLRVRAAGSGLPFDTARKPPNSPRSCWRSSPPNPIRTSPSSPSSTSSSPTTTTAASTSSASTSSSTASTGPANCLTTIGADPGAQAAAAA